MDHAAAPARSMLGKWTGIRAVLNIVLSLRRFGAAGAAGSKNGPGNQGRRPLELNAVQYDR